MDILAKLEVLQASSGALPEFYDNRYLHTRERMEQRYNLQLTREDWQKLNLAIFTDAANTRWIDIGDSSAASLYTIEYRGETMLMAWSETAYAVMTVMPRTDLRLLHIRENRYIYRANGAGDTAFRDARQALAADLESMTLNSKGNLVKPQAAGGPEAAPEPPKYQPFKEALAGFKPAPKAEPALEPGSKRERPILTVVTKADDPAFDPNVLATFAALKRYLDEQDEAVASDDETAEEEVRQLEERIAQIRSGAVLAQMKREFLGTSRKLAEEAFGKYRDGLFNVEAALSVASLISAQQEPTKQAPPRLLVAPQQHRQARGLEGVSREGPDPVEIRTGKRSVYRIDGIEDSITGWAHRAGIYPQMLTGRIAKGMTFREALFAESKRSRV